MKIEVLTLFPEIYPGPLGSSVIGRAIGKNILELKAVDLRDYTHDRRGTVDDSPYGGGPGMLMKVEPLMEALEDLAHAGKRVILMGPRGRKFDQKIDVNWHRKMNCCWFAGTTRGWMNGCVC